MESAVIQIITPTKEALVFGNSEFSSATDFQATAEDLKKAYRELNEREDVKQDCLRKLKDRLEGDEVFLYRTDYSYLLRYLRYTKFNVDKAYNSIRNLHSLRLKNPEIFSLPSNLETLLNHGFATFLPYKDQEGRLVSIVDFRKWNTEKMSVCEVLSTVSVIYDIFLMNPHAQISGSVGIFDFRGASLRHLAHFLKSSMKIVLGSMFKECYPLRTKIILVIHRNPILRKMSSAVRYAMTKKMQNRVKVLGSDMTELHQYVNPAVLPKDYGGNLEESECSITDLIIENLPYLKYERSFGRK